MPDKISMGHGSEKSVDNLVRLCGNCKFRDEEELQLGCDLYFCEFRGCAVSIDHYCNKHLYPDEPGWGSE